MADPLVVFDDLELYLTSWYRAWLATRPEPVCAGVEVDRAEPPPDQTFPPKLIVIRDDGITRTSFITGDAQIGVSILAGTTANPQDAKDLARIVLAGASRIPTSAPGNPFASLDGSTGPYLVPEQQPHARAYLTLGFSVVAREL